MPKNPSEIARLQDEYEYWRLKVGNLSSPKSTREEALHEMRKLEEQLGLEHKPYNGK